MSRLGLKMVPLAAALLALVAGCDGDGSSNKRQAAETTATEGFLVEVNPIFPVERIGRDEGQLGLSGALIEGIDLEGNLVGASVTASNGFYRLEDLPPGYLQLVAHKDRNGGVDSITELWLGNNRTVDAPDQEFPIDREEAIDQAFFDVEDDVLALSTVRPLPAGTRVLPAGSLNGPVPSALARTLPAAEWFFMFDPTPFAPWAHGVIYRFVNATTGEVRTVEAEFYPLINGAPHWETFDELFDFTGVAGRLDVADLDPDLLPDGAPVASPEVIQLPPVPDEPFDPLADAVFNPEPAIGPNDGICALLVQGAQGLTHAFDVLAWEDYLINVIGLPAEQVETVFLRRRPSQPAKSQALFEIEIDQALRRLNAIITARHDDDNETTILYYFSSNGTPGRIFLGDLALTAEQLTLENDTEGASQEDRLRLMDTRACRVRFFFEVPYSGRLAREVAEFVEDRPRRLPQHLLAFSATDGNSLSGRGTLAGAMLGYDMTPESYWTRAVLGQISFQEGDVVSLIVEDPDPRLATVVASVVSDPEGTEQGAEFHEAGDPLLCDAGRRPPGRFENPELGRLVIEIVNESPERVTFRLVSNERVINNNQPIVLNKRGGSFSLEATGAISGLAMEDIVLSENRRLDDLGGFDVDLNQQLVLRWRRVNGADILVVDRGTVSGIEDFRPPEEEEED